MTYEIIDQELFDARKTYVDIIADTVTVTFTDEDQLCTYESWGEHGPNDFAEWGFKIVYK